MKRIVPGLLLLAALVATGVGAQGAGIARISVLSNGSLYLNGKPTDLRSIESELQRLKQVKGTVWYHRDNPQAEPPKEGMAVVDMIIQHRLPVSMSTRPDFSDYVDSQGRSRPRTPGGPQ